MGKKSKQNEIAIKDEVDTSEKKSSNQTNLTNVLCNNNSMFCDKCNQTRDGKFCSECGSKLNEVKSTILPNNPACVHSEQKENHSLENQFDENKDGASHSNITGSKAVENEDLFCITHPKTNNYEGIKTVEVVPEGLLEESSYNKSDSKSNENSEKTEDLASENKPHEGSNHLVSNPSENTSVCSPAENVDNNNDGKEKLNNLLNNTKEKDMDQAENKPHERSNHFESNPLENIGIFSSAKNAGNNADDEEKLNNLSNSTKVEDVDLPENKLDEKNDHLESNPVEKNVNNADDEEKLNNLSNSTKVEDVDLPENKLDEKNDHLESNPVEKNVNNADDEEKLNNLSNSTKVEDVDLPENKLYEKNDHLESNPLEKNVVHNADDEEKLNNLSNSTKVEDVDLPENKPDEKNNHLESNPVENKGAFSSAKNVGNNADDKEKPNRLSKVEGLIQKYRIHKKYKSIKVQSKSKKYKSTKVEDVELPENKSDEKNHHLESNPVENKGVCSSAKNIGNNNDNKEKLNSLSSNTKEEDVNAKKKLNEPGNLDGQPEPVFGKNKNETSAQKSLSFGASEKPKNNSSDKKTLLKESEELKSKQSDEINSTYEQENASNENSDHSKNSYSDAVKKNATPNQNNTAKLQHQNNKTKDKNDKLISHDRNSNKNVGYQHHYAEDKKPQRNQEQTNQNADQVFDGQLFNVEVPDHNKIIVSFYIWAQKQIDNLYIMFGHEDLGSWEKPAVCMKCQSENLFGYLYQGDLICSKEVFRKTKAVEYKYFISKKKMKIYENLEYAPQSDHLTNRLLVISKDFLDVLDKDLKFFQVDDIFLPPKEKENQSYYYTLKGLFFQNSYPTKEIYVTIFNQYIIYLEKQNYSNIETSMFIRSLETGFYGAYSMTKNQQIEWKKIDEKHIQGLFTVLERQITSVKDHEEIFFWGLSRLLIFYDKQNLINFAPINFISLLFEILSLENVNWTSSNILKNITNKFPEILLRFIHDALISLLKCWLVKNSYSIGKTHVWCYALLLIHHITSESQQKLKGNPESLNASNCGLPTFFEKINCRFYEETLKNLNQIKWSLQNDVLLQRGIAYKTESKHFVTLLKTGVFSERLLVNMMTYKMKSNIYTNLIFDCKNFLDELLKLNLHERNYNRGYLVEALINMLHVLLEKIDINDVSCKLLSKILNCINTFYKSIDPLDEVMPKIEKTVLKCKSNVTKNFKIKLGEKSCNWITLINLKTQLKVIALLVDLKIAKGDDFKELAIDILKNKVKSARKQLLLEAYCELDILSYNELIQTPFTESFSATIEEMSQMNYDSRWLYKLSSGYSPMLIKFITKKWECLNSIDEKINFCLTWKPFKVLLDQLGKKSKSEETAIFICEVVSVFQHIFEIMNNGKITISFMINLISKKEILYKLLEVVKVDFYDNFKARFDLCMMQLNCFHRVEEVVNYTLQLCKAILPNIVKTEVLDGIYRSEYSVLTCKEVFVETTQELNNEKVSDFQDLSNEAFFINNVCAYFGISFDWFEHASRMTDCKIMSSFLFKKEIELFAKDKVAINYTDLIESIILPTTDILKNKFVDIVSCKISPSKVVSIFKEFKEFQQCKNELFLLNKFLNLMFETMKIETCVEKINCVFLMEKYSNDASTILEVKENLKLHGDFTAVENMMRPINEIENLESIDNDLKDLADFFEDFSTSISKIFKAILSCLQLFSWLKDNLKDPKEVKVFVEIMSIAAGETDYEVDRVKCFEACCLAFSHIIFDLDKESGYKDLLEACKHTQKMISNDSKIFKKLIDTNHDLEWFKNAKKSQGSVATKSIMEAQIANRKGYFVIGNQKSGCVDFLEFNLADVIKFQIQNEDSTVKDYTLEEVNDLQSRLMLLGGHIGDKSVEDKQKEKDYFVEVVEVVTRLGYAYMSLCEAGDIKFIQWQKTFYCDIELERGVSIKDLIIESEKLEKRFMNWKEKLTTFRHLNPIINYFSVKQCLFMQKQLFMLIDDLNHVDRLPTQFYTLLYFFAHDVNVNNIRHTFNLSRILTIEDESQQWQTAIIQSNFDKCTPDEILDIVNTLREVYDISENVAWASIIEIFPYREGKAVVWCGKQDSESENINELELKAKVQFQQMKSNNSSNAKHKDEKKPYLTIDELGRFLKHYKDITNFQFSKRIVPPYINKNKPNLIVLSHDEIMYAVLEIYLYQDGVLPTSEEVLLCDDSVSIEEIELLIMRAVDNKNGLYCLVINENLKYETCEKMYSFLQKTIQIGIMSPLLVFCSSENHHNSYIVTALDHFKQKIPSYLSRDQICEKLTLCLRNKLLDQKAGIIFNESIYKSLVVKSMRSGMGKSFFVEKCGSQLSSHLDAKYQTNMSNSQNKNSLVIVSVHGTVVNTDAIVERLLQFEERPNAFFPRLYHFDITPMVREGLDSFLFNLVVLGSLKTSTGKVWRMNNNDTCIIEITINHSDEQSNNGPRESQCFSVVANMLPCITCISPNEVLDVLQGQEMFKMVWFDKEEHKKSSMQRVCQYLQLYDTNRSLLNTFAYNPTHPAVNLQNSLKILLKYCGVQDPCWSELRNFIHFFNTQLIDCEQCAFTSIHVVEDLRGFKIFVISFLLEMAQDFSTRSISLDDYYDSSQLMVQLKRKWEHSSHPYLFFNQDHVTMTFFGFNIDLNGNLLDPDRRTIIKQGIMTKDLYDDLNRQMRGTEWGCLNTNYKTLSRKSKLDILCRVIGMDSFDPDPSYELTVDNMKKILAIHMRLRCVIPVIMMGETGCGKTKLIKFMCALRAGKKRIQNMLLVKVHGGVTHQDILIRIEQAKRLAKENYEYHKINTVLFFDEANTSDAIGLIKEIMVDKRADGKPLGLAECGLEIIAACNPYKKHSENMIKKLESAGLGYHVNSKSTYEKIGDIPLRQLVYRVHPLPTSMVPLVWDFGQLDSETEEAYARQIISRFVNEGKLPNDNLFFELIVCVLKESQAYMRRQKDECSFVSLRDVERALLVTSWFYRKMDLFINITDNEFSIYNKMQWAIIYSLSVCYIAKLEDRDSYRKYISKFFTGHFKLINGAQEIKDKVVSLQKNILKEIKLEDNIAQNEALCENVFMMVICIELRIPLFVVGKPGSSKSLAKSIIQDCMQGNMSKSRLFKHFKQIFMSSYQCSPLSTADGIINTFKQCSRFQEGKDLETFTSVVVLDEVGLAEDSPRMPLKALHPLLEDGTDGSEELTLDNSSLKSKRVAFIGISNWSLDPAKMNRGIMLYRGQPDLEELVETARNICLNDEYVFGMIASLFEPLTKGYLEVYEKQNKCDIIKKYRKEEFFGLRDFYSLLKLVFCFARKQQNTPTYADIEHAVKRNFSGLQELDTWSIFKSCLPYDFSVSKDTEADISALHLIADSFADKCPCYEYRLNSEKTDKAHCLSSRYLLLMTDDYAALPIIEQHYLKPNQKSTVIFGSSFPKDQQFTQVCRDINRVKICMETGTRVVLLNMENLYESLYDTLNQYYVSLGGKNYVDLGIGTHRVKCRVHEDFRLIVIADKENVYNTFPIPLINRLEKHFLTVLNGMEKSQIELAEKLKKWASDFSSINSLTHEFKPSDSFIGYSEDSCASIIIKLYQKYVGNSEVDHDKVGEVDHDKIFEESCHILLKLATPDSLLRVVKTSLRDHFEYYWNIYFNEQFHHSLAAYLINELDYIDSKFMQVTTFSRLLSPTDKENLNIELYDFKIEMISLMQFQTEKSFRDCLRVVCNAESNKKQLLIIQANNAQERSKLIACAQYICKESQKQFRLKNISVLFILQLNYKAKRLDLLSSLSFWECCHIDELRSSNLPYVVKYYGKSLKEIINLDDIKPKMIQLILGCVQMTIRRLSEMKQMTIDEISQRIDIITNLLTSKPDDIRYMFITTVFRLLETGLAAEESKWHPDYVTNWIQNEAIEQKYQPSYGTFRHALFCYMEDRIVPVLTSIVSSIDRFYNLEILHSEPEYTMLWLELFSKFTVISNNAPNKLLDSYFRCKFPFSDRIFKEIDDALQNCLQPDATHETHEYKHIYDTIGSLPMASLIMGSTTMEVDSYLFDILRIKYPDHLQSSELGLHSYKILAYGLISFTNSVIISRNKCYNACGIKLNDIINNTNCDIVSIHIALNTKIFEERLKSISLMLILQPKLKEAKLGQESEIDIDVHLMNHFLSHLASKRFCPGVIEEIRKTKVLINCVFEAVIKSKCNNATKEMVKKLQIRWCSFRICQKFSDVVFQTSTSFCNHQIDLLTSLWKKLETLPNDMLTCESWYIVEEFLKESLSIDYSNISEDCSVNNSNEACNTEFNDRDLYQESLERRHMVFEKEEFKKRCISFYAEVVAEFCFSRKDFDRVDTNVIKNILDYVFSSKTTKVFSPIPDYALDPTPVIRSFLLQQLLQRNYNEVQKYLSHHLAMLFSHIDQSQLLEVAKLFIYCMEDKKELDFSTLIKDTVINSALLEYVLDELDAGYNFAQLVIPGESLKQVSLLERVAALRITLTVSAQVLCTWFLEGTFNETKVKRNFDSFLALLTKFILKYKDSQPYFYFLKQIVRNYGIQGLKEIVLKPEVDWLLNQDENVNNMTSYDKFLVYGKHYKKVRDRLVICILEDNLLGITQLEEDDENKTNMFLQLSLFKGLSNLPSLAILKDKIKIQTCLSAIRSFSTLESYSSILYHFWVVINSGNPSTHLFLLLATRPQQVYGWFLPAMPHDNLSDVFGLNHSDNSNSFLFYACPRGHPYVITNCGRPNQTYVCPVPNCGLAIGGESHTLLSTNQIISNRVDATKPGHCLGPASERSNFSIPQRELTPLSVTLQNLLVHLSLLVATLTGHVEHVVRLVHPEVNSDTMQMFLIQHIEKDLALLSNRIAKNNDDTNSAIHTFFKHLLLNDEPDNIMMVDLTSVQIRNQYENAFDRKFIQPFFNLLDEELLQFNKFLMADRCINDSPLMRKIFELDAELDLSNVTVMSPQLWLYRQSVSVESLKVAVQLKVAGGGAKDILILVKFLEQESVLSMIKELPLILELQKILQHEFNYKLDKKTAVDKTVVEFLSDINASKPGIGKKVDKLIKCFIKTWNHARGLLTEREKRLEPNLPSIKLDNKCSLAYFIAARSDHGLCASMLIDFLAFQQNEFLEECRMMNPAYVFQHVPILQLKETDIISYEQKRDLFPLVLLNCDYSLGIGKAPKIEHNLETIQRRLYENVIFGKALIDREIIPFFYRGDIKSLNFPLLRSSIQQTFIPYSEQKRMLDEMIDIADVSVALRAVETVIGIITSTGGECNMYLRDYLTNILRMNEQDYIVSGKMHDYIRLTHLYSVWLMLTVEQACRIYTSKQVPFHVKEIFLSEDLENEVVEKMKKRLHLVDRKELINLITEYIVLELPLRNEADISLMLSEALQLYKDKQGTTITTSLEPISDEFLLKHIYLFWKIVASHAKDFDN
ncbi:E3 ubiquitin-protein ligase rnf213-alpha-like isoform X2 [Hydra vulgaris]|uniref:E3 ubiquitin-protein ligase rnf213-alpha-like isoform X2 n=1 Tax=Hydra vulgaris TaxID=6087 RepID=A0ABM4DPK7_HYDVU